MAKLTSASVIDYTHPDIAPIEGHFVVELLEVNHGTNLVAARSERCWLGAKVAFDSPGAWLRSAWLLRGSCDPADFVGPLNEQAVPLGQVDLARSHENATVV